MSRFDPIEAEARSPVAADELGRLARAHGFDPVDPPPEMVAGERERGRQILALFERPIRDDPPWGHCALTVLLDPTTERIELDATAFPSAREPKRLRKLRSALTRFLTDNGYGLTE